MSENKDTVWTVLVYLAGDNNLSEEMIYAIKEMYRIGVVQDIDLIIQFDPSGIGPRVRRYDIGNFEKNRKVIDEDAESRGIKADAADNKVDIDGKLEALRDDDFEKRNAGLLRKKFNLSSNENSSDPRVLRDFIIESLKLKTHDHPHVTHYMVVLSGHGSGAEGDFLTDLNPGGPGSLSIPHLQWVFDQVKKSGVLKSEEQKIDILGMDSCLMSTTEVCYQLRDYVKFLVGAEGFEQNTGWPYHRILEMLRDTDDEANVADKIVGIYSRYYRDYEVAGASTDQAACNVKQLAELLVPRVQELAQELQSGFIYRAIKDGILLAHWEAQSYKGEQYVDLFDFCDRLQIRCEAERDALKAKQNAQKDLQTDVGSSQVWIREQLDSLQEYRMRALKALDLTKPAKEEDFTPAWQLLYDQLGSQQQELMDAWRSNNIAEVRKALYKQLEPQDRKVTDLVEQQLDPVLAKAGRSLLDQLYPKNSEVNDLIGWLEPQPLQDARFRALLLGQLDPEHQPLMGALKDQNAPEVRKALYDQLDSKQRKVIAALEQNNLAEAWALLGNQLNAIADACSRVKGAIEEDKPRVVLNSCYSGPAFQHSHGLSVYFPWFEDKAVLDEYARLDFAVHTGWAKFLKTYLRATRRPRRNQEDHLGKIPVRIDPPVNSPVVVPIFSAIRMPGEDSRGSSFGRGSMKNPPDGFYRKDCK